MELDDRIAKSIEEAVAAQRASKNYEHIIDTDEVEVQVKAVGAYVRIAIDRDDWPGTSAIKKLAMKYGGTTTFELDFITEIRIRVEPEE